MATKLTFRVPVVKCSLDVCVGERLSSSKYLSSSDGVAVEYYAQVDGWLFACLPVACSICILGYGVYFIQLERFHPDIRVGGLKKSTTGKVVFAV